MDVAPKAAQIEQLAGTLEAIMTQASGFSLLSSQIASLEQAANLFKARNPQGAQQIATMEQVIPQTKLIISSMDTNSALSSQITTTIALWANIRTDIIENVLPEFSADSNAIIRQIITQIDYHWNKINSLTIGSFISANTAASNLRLLASYLKNPPTLLSKDASTETPKLTASPEKVNEIFAAGVADSKEQIKYYSWAGWAALVFGLSAVAAAVCVPFKWDISPDLKTTAFVAALIARLLAIGVLVYVATVLLQRHRDMVHLAARAREFRSYLQMISAMPFFGGDKDSIDVITNILKQYKDKSMEGSENTEKGFFLPAEALKTILPLLEKLTGK